MTLNLLYVFSFGYRLPSFTVASFAWTSAADVVACFLSFVMLLKYYFMIIWDWVVFVGSVFMLFSLFAIYILIHIHTYYSVLLLLVLCFLFEYFVNVLLHMHVHIFYYSPSTWFTYTQGKLLVMLEFWYDFCFYWHFCIAATQCCRIFFFNFMQPIETTIFSFKAYRLG